MRTGESTPRDLREYIIIDTETTGFSPEDHRVIEVGALHVRDGEILGEYQALVRTVDDVPWVIENVTGISSDMLEQRGRFPEEVFPELRQFIGDRIFVAHNVYFDFNFLNAEFIRHDLDMMQNLRICTVRTAKAGMPRLPDYKLSTIKTFLNLTYQSHRALTDAYVCHEIMKRYGEYASVYDTPVLRSKYSGLNRLGWMRA